MIGVFRRLREDACQGVPKSTKTRTVSSYIIDGSLVGVEVDNAGEPLIASPLPCIAQPSWWKRITTRVCSALLPGKSSAT
jgi:hypothetical protein